MQNLANWLIACYDHAHMLQKNLREFYIFFFLPSLVLEATDVMYTAYCWKNERLLVYKFRVWCNRLIRFSRV
jgi:hypothetical protein